MTKGNGAGDGSPPAAAAWEAHCLLAQVMEDLTAIERRRKDRSQDVAMGIEALSVVIDLIEADDRSRDANAAGPLKRVQVALHDMQAGKKPAMLYDPPPRAGKPNNTVSDGIRGSLAAAVHALLAAGVPRNEAGAWVARRVIAARIPIGGLRKEGVTAKRILRWRDEFGAASSVAFTECFMLTDSFRDGLNRPITLAEAEAVAESFIVAARAWTA